MIQPFAADFGLKQPARELKVKKAKTDGGRQITRFQQTYQDIPVMAGELVVNATDRGSLLSINGEISPDLSLSTAPAVTAQEAQQTALESVAKWRHGEVGDFQASEPQLWVYDARLLQPDGTPPALVWRMDVTSSDPALSLNELVLVDAERGSIRLHFNQVDMLTAPDTAPMDWVATGYSQLIADAERGVLYGLDSGSTGWVDVISASTLQVLNRYTIPGWPWSFALSPDGSELAVTVRGEQPDILFLDPETGATIASLILPTDVLQAAYGREGRLYAVGFDYLHVIDTATHTEIARSSESFDSNYRLAFSPDNSALYAVTDCQLMQFDVSTDSLPTATAFSLHNGVGCELGDVSIDSSGDLLFIGMSLVWSISAQGPVARLPSNGKSLYLPAHDAVLVTYNNELRFFSVPGFSPLSTYELPPGTGVGAIVAWPDGSKVLLRSPQMGMVAVDLTAFPPGTPGASTGATRPYADLVADDANGVLYGSDTAGNKVDVISMSTAQVIQELPFNVGAAPIGMDLSGDGNQLAVALSGIDSVAFIDTSTREMSVSTHLDPEAISWPYDVVYGRAGRLYISERYGSHGIRAIDTETDTELATLSHGVPETSRLAVSTDGNSLYSIGSGGIHLFDVSTDNPPAPIETASGTAHGSALLLLADESALYTDTGEIWRPDLSSKIGVSTASGYLVEIPSLDAVAGLSKTSPGSIVFASRGAIGSSIGQATIPGVSSFGPSAINTDSSVLFMNTDGGIKTVPVLPSSPFAIAAVSGAMQWTRPLSAFPESLNVQITNILGNGIEGLPVTFTAPGSGPTARFANGTGTLIVPTDADGIAAAEAPTANEIAGAFRIEAAVDGPAATASFALVNSSIDIRTYSMDQHTAEDGALPGRLLCGNPQSSCTNGADPDADHAESYAAGMYTFLHSKVGRDSLDGAGMPIILSVHYGTDFPNALWVGDQAVFGDGWTTDDIVGHELMHGVTQHTSNLFYYYESGAINESLSDIFGELYDRSNGVENSGVDDGTWKIGEELPGGALRSMKDPTLYHDPDSTFSFWYDRDEDMVDNGGVHHNSGVNNKAAYLLIQGGTFGDATVPALGVDKTIAIYYEANANLLTSGANFTDLAASLYQACLNLAGGPTGILQSDCVSVERAVQAVAMDKISYKVPYNYTRWAPICDTGFVPVNLFFDGFESGTGNWALSSSRWQLNPPDADFVHTGRRSLYANDYPAGRTDAIAAMRSGITLPANAYLNFAHAFDFEHYSLHDGSGYDGGVVEYSVNGGRWQDAGPLMDFNSYPGGIYPGAGNPLGGRPAFIVLSGGYISTRLNLSSLAGQNVRFRWRMGLDYYGWSWGWWLDDIRIYACESTSTPNASVLVKGAPTGSHYVPQTTSGLHSYTGIQDGPVQVHTNVPMIASERGTFGPYETFNEVMGYPNNQLTTHYWFPWYDNLNMITWVLVGNPSTTQTANVTIKIAGATVGTYFIPPMGNVTPTFSGIENGPVEVLSNINVFASQRVLMGWPSGAQSFDEVLGFPHNKLTTHYWFTWYDNKDMQTAVMVGNPSTTATATVTIKIAGATMDTYSLPPRSTHQSVFDGVQNGPVEVLANRTVFASERGMFGTSGMETFNEVIGFPHNQLTNNYWFPWYDNQNMITWVLVGNPSATQTATVTIKIAGSTVYTNTIAPMGNITPTFAGVVNGPVQVTSNIPVFTSERALAGWPGTAPSFNEILGIANTKLTTDYWFTWYDDKDMTTDVVIARP
jgi:Zn-dependent metalloprotease